MPTLSPFKEKYLIGSGAFTRCYSLPYNPEPLESIWQDSFDYHLKDLISELEERGVLNPTVNDLVLLSSSCSSKRIYSDRYFFGGQHFPVVCPIVKGVDKSWYLALRLDPWNASLLNSEDLVFAKYLHKNLTNLDLLKQDPGPLLEPYAHLDLCQHLISALSSAMDFFQHYAKLEFNRRNLKFHKKTLIFNDIFVGR